MKSDKRKVINEKVNKYLLSFIFIYLISPFQVWAQGTDDWQHEYQNEIPVYIDSLQQQLTYPLAWGHAKEKNFAKWRKKARAKVFECMMTPPPAPDRYDLLVLAEEQRDGYRAQKIEFWLSRWYRVKAYLLIPDGKGPFPAVNLLHDHGAHLSIS